MTSFLKVVLFLALMSPLAVRGEDDSFTAQVYYNRTPGLCHLGQYRCLYGCCFLPFDFRRRCCTSKSNSPCCWGFKNSGSTLLTGVPSNYSQASWNVIPLTHSHR